MRQTLPKSIILRGHQSFTTVITGGTQFQGTMLTAFLLTGTDDQRMMIGFSVPKKQVPGAVDRNRIKRLMRESVRKNIHELKTAAIHKTGGARIVVMFRRHKSTDLRRLSLHDIEPSWHDLHRRILEAL